MQPLPPSDSSPDSFPSTFQERVSGTDRMENEEHAFEDFRNALLHQSPKPVLTALLVLSNVMVFVWMVSDGVSPFQPSAIEIIDWGANYAPRTLDGEEWRLFTCMFLHIGILHLGMNMLALWNLGRILERLVGHTGFILLYFISGLAGSLASVSWNPVNPSAGASGAIFGVAGALLGVSWKLRRSLPPAFLKSSRILALNVLALFVVFTVINHFHPMIDNSAHLAGFLTGTVCGLLLGEPIPNPGRSLWVLRNLILAVVGTAGLVMAFGALPKPPTDVVKLLQKYDRVNKIVYDQDRQEHGRYKAGAISPKEYAAFLERNVLPRWQELYEDFAGAKNVPPVYKSVVESYTRALMLFRTGIELKIEALRDLNNPQKVIRSKQAFDEANAIIQRVHEEVEQSSDAD